MTLAAALARRAACDYRGERSELRGAERAEELLELGRVLEELGEYEDAERVLERAAALARPHALARLAVVLRAMRRSVEAEAAAREAAELAAGGAVEVEADALLELALSHLDLDRRDDAARELAQARPLVASIPQGLAGDRLRFTLRCADGTLARDRGAYADAERMFTDALAFAERQFGAESIEAASALNGLGMVYKFWGRFDDGTPVYVRAVSIVERAGGEEHPDLASLYHNLGGLEHARGDYAAAERHARRSLELRARTAGAGSVGVAEDEAALASILHGLGRDEEAEELLRRALPILEDALGQDHHEVGAALNNLGRGRGDLYPRAATQAAALRQRASERRDDAEQPRRRPTPPR